MQPNGGTVHVVYQDGTSLTAAKTRVHMTGASPAVPKAERAAQAPRPRGARAGNEVEALAAGQGAVVRVQRDAATGEVLRVKIKVFPTVAGARAFLDERAARRAARDAARASGTPPAAAARPAAERAAGN